MLTRGGEESPAEEVVGGVHVHRVREPTRPDRPRRVRRLGRADELRHARRRGRARRPLRLRPRPRPRLAGRQRLRPPRQALRRAAGDDDPRDRARPPPGLGRQAPAGLHPRRRALDHQPLRAGDRLLRTTCASRSSTSSASRRSAIDGDPERDRPRGPAAPGRRPSCARLRAEFAAPDEKLVLLVGRLVYEKGFQLALEAMPRADRARARRRASWSPARAPTRQELHAPGRGARA